MTKMSKRGKGPGCSKPTIESIAARMDKLMARGTRADRRGTFKGSLRAAAADAELAKMDAVIAAAGYTVDDVLAVMLRA
jgi:hypothetical protein